MADHYVEAIRIKGGKATVVCSCGEEFGPHKETDNGIEKGRAEYAAHYETVDTSNDIVRED